MKNLFVFILFAAALYALNQYAFPAWQSIQSYQGDIKNLQDVEVKAQGSDTVRKKLIADYKSIDPEKIARLDALFPKELGKDDTYYFFQQLTVNSGMQLKSISLTDSGDSAGAQSTAPNGTSKFISFNLGVIGSYYNMRTLLNNIENNGRLMDIDSISVAEDDKKVFTLTITGKMYYGLQ